MAKKYRNKYRIKSIRLPNWDYGWNGSYFITICTQNRKHFFGEIVNSKMQLSEIGMFAEKYWYVIPQHFPFVKLGAFVVMPNHIHGIIIIKKTNLDHNPKIWHRLFVDIKLVLQKMQRKSIQCDNGNPDIMNILFAMKIRLKEYQNTLLTIR